MKSEATPDELRTEIRRLRDCIVSARWRLAKGRAFWNGPCHECDAALERGLTGQVIEGDAMTDLSKTTPYEELTEDAEDRQMFNQFCITFGGAPIRRVATALATWHKMAPKQGSYGKMLAIYANECVKAAGERDELVAALRELVSQIEKSNAVDDHGHALMRLKALADARAVLAKIGI